MTASILETHRNDTPALICVSTFDYLGFSCKYGLDRETGDWLMEIDGQPVGFAVSDSVARSTMREHCEEVARHTQIVTADMEAEALAERSHPEWSCTPENPCDGECSEHSLDRELEAQGLRLAAPDEAGWYVLVNGGKKVWATDAAAPRVCRLDAQGNRWSVCGAPGDEPCMCGVVIAVARPMPVLEAPAGRSEPAPVAPPRTVKELREELERVTDAIHERKAVGAGYARLHQQRSRIIAELDAAHKAADRTADQSGDQPHPTPTSGEPKEESVEQRLEEAWVALTARTSEEIGQELESIRRRAFDIPARNLQREPAKALIFEALATAEGMRAQIEHALGAMTTTPRSIDRLLPDPCAEIKEELQSVRVMLRTLIKANEATITAEDAWARDANDTTGAELQEAHSVLAISLATAHSMLKQTTPPPSTTLRDLEKAQLELRHMSEVAQTEAGVTDPREAMRLLRDEREALCSVLGLAESYLTTIAHDPDHVILQQIRAVLKK